MNKKRKQQIINSLDKANGDYRTVAHRTYPKNIERYTKLKSKNGILKELSPDFCEWLEIVRSLNVERILADNTLTLYERSEHNE